MRKKKISELPLAESLAGLHTIGVDKSNNSVKVGLEFVVAGALRALFVARGAVWNEKTGFYELNGLLDITEREMLTIYVVTSSSCASKETYRFTSINFRTNFPEISRRVTTSLEICYHSNPQLEVCNTSRIEHIENLTYAFGLCPKLRKIIGTLAIDLITAQGKVTNAFIGCTSLYEVFIKYAKLSISLSDSPALNRESILYFINNAANTTPITLTLHADAAARLTPEDIALASSKNITIA